MTQQEKSPRVLIVDDEASVLRIVERILQTGGYKTRPATSGAEALAIDAAEGPFDLLLTDLAMPEMQGDELARRLHQQHHETKVLYLTAYLDKLFTVRATLWDDESVVEKPATAKDLLEAVSMALFGHPRGLKG